MSHFKKSIAKSQSSNIFDHELEFEGFCKCCGSINVATIDTEINSAIFVSDVEKLNKRRLWKSFQAMGYSDISSIAYSISDSASLEEPDDLMCAFHDIVRGQIDIYLKPANPTKVEEPIPLELIEEYCSDDFSDDRKRAFFWIWKNFSKDTQSAFLSYVANCNTVGGMS